MAEYGLWLALLRRGILTGFSTNSHARTPVLRFFPPLTVERADIDRALAALADSLAELGRTPTTLLDLADVALPLQYRLPRAWLRTVGRALFS